MHEFLVVPRSMVPEDCTMATTETTNNSDTQLICNGVENGAHKMKEDDKEMDKEEKVDKEEQEVNVEENGEEKEKSNESDKVNRPNIVLRIPQTRLNNSSVNGVEEEKKEEQEQVKKEEETKEGDTKHHNGEIEKEDTTEGVTNGEVAKTEEEKVPSRRSSYIDVVGLAEEGAVGVVTEQVKDVTTAEAAIDDSEDEDKLVINEASDKKDEEVTTKRPNSDDSEQPKKKLRVEEVGGDDKEVVALISPDEGKGMDALSSANQVDDAISQVNKELVVIQDSLAKKEEEWNVLLRALKDKQELLVKLKRRETILQFQSGAIPSLPKESSRRGSGLLAALTGAHSPLNYGSESPLSMMSKLLTAQGNGVSSASTTPSSVSVIDIHTSSRSSPSSITPSHSSLSDSIKSKLTRQLLGQNTGLLTKPILPKPPTPLGGPSMQQGALSGLLNAVSKDHSAGGLNSSGATGFGPQGPTISVQQLIASYRKDNPSHPPVRGAKRGAWRQKYDAGGKRGGSNPSVSRGSDGGHGITLSDPTISYNDMLLQFAQLTQQHNNNQDKGALPPQISIIPVTEGTSTITSLSGTSGGVSVTPAINKPPSNIMEPSSALAKLLMESRGAQNKQNSLLDHQQSQSLANTMSSSVSTSTAQQQQYLTLSALLSGSTTTAREKAAAALANVHQSASKKSSENGVDNPKCQGCHKVRAQFVCAGCGNQWYCSRECQVAAWDDHSEKCNS